MVYDLATGGLMKKDKKGMKNVEDVEENGLMYKCFLINIKI